MTLADVGMLNKSFVQHPPVDLLVASYLGYKSPDEKDSDVSVKHARRANSQAMKTIPFGKMKSIEQMPDFVRSPEKLAMIERLKREAAG